MHLWLNITKLKKNAVEGISQKMKPDTQGQSDPLFYINTTCATFIFTCAKNKLLAAADIIATKHTSERIMVFSETIESIEKLKEMLQNKGIKSMLIDSKLSSKKRQIILSEWGKEF